MLLPSHIEQEAQGILARFSSQETSRQQLTDVRKIIEDYYALACFDANKSGQSRVGGLVGATVAGAGIFYTGGVSAMANPLISSVSAIVGSKLTQAAFPIDGSLTGLMNAINKSLPKDESKIEQHHIEVAITNMRDALENLKRSVSTYQKEIKTSPEAKLAVSGMVVGIGLAYCGSYLFPSCFGPTLSASMPILGSLGLLPNEKISKKITGDCLMGEMLVTTDQVNLATCPTLTSQNAQTCIIVVINDLNNPANAVMAHIDIGVWGYIQMSIQNAIDLLRNAGSRPENLRVELFGGINTSDLLESTYAISDPIQETASRLGVREDNIVYKHCPSGKEEVNGDKLFYAIDVTYDRRTGKAEPTITREENYQLQFGEISKDMERMNRAMSRMAFDPRLPLYNRAIKTIIVEEAVISTLDVQAITGLRQRNLIRP